MASTMSKLVQAFRSVFGKFRPPTSNSTAIKQSIDPAATAAGGTSALKGLETKADSNVATVATDQPQKAAAEPINIVPVFDPLVVTSNKEIQKEILKEDASATTTNTTSPPPLSIVSNKKVEKDSVGASFSADAVTAADSNNAKVVLKDNVKEEPSILASTDPPLTVEDTLTKVKVTESTSNDTATYPLPLVKSTFNEQVKENTVNSSTLATSSKDSAKDPISDFAPNTTIPDTASKVSEFTDTIAKDDNGEVAQPNPTLDPPIAVANMVSIASNIIPEIPTTTAQTILTKPVMPTTTAQTILTKPVMPFTIPTPVRIRQVIKPHIPLIKFRKGALPQFQAASPAAPAVAPAVAPMAAAPVTAQAAAPMAAAAAASAAGVWKATQMPVREWYDTPTRFKRRAVDDLEIDLINGGGCDKLYE